MNIGLETAALLLQGFLSRFWVPLSLVLVQEDNDRSPGLYLADPPHSRLNLAFDEGQDRPAYETKGSTKKDDRADIDACHALRTDE